MQMLCRYFVAENSINEILSNNIIKLEDYTIIYMCVASSFTGLSIVLGQKLLSVRKVDIRACKCMLRQQDYTYVRPIVKDPFFLLCSLCQCKC